MAATVYDYFQQALLRPHADPGAGSTIRDEGDNKVCFVVTWRDGCITHADFRATTCATLVAVCEHLCDLATGLKLSEAEAIDAGRLLALHPEIPLARHNRAKLAVRAFHYALQGNQ